MPTAWLWTNFEGARFRVREVAEIFRNSSNGDAEDVIADAGVVRNGVFDNAACAKSIAGTLSKAPHRGCLEDKAVP